jgi:soluble lytic murein transglycosylase-like protein
MLPPLAVLLIGGLLAFLALRPDPQAAAPAAAATEGAPALATGAVLQPLSRVFTPEIQYWGKWIQAWAAEAGLDPNLAATVMQIESCGNPLARSRAGAMGLFQVMPFHFTASDDPYDPATNARRGLAYLKRALDAAAGVPRLALAGYNGGISVIRWAESSWSAETQRYVFLGDAIYADAASGVDSSPRLQSWLAEGGASFCRTAARSLGITP